MRRLLSARMIPRRLSTCNGTGGVARNLLVYLLRAQFPIKGNFGVSASIIRCFCFARMLAAVAWKSGKAPPRLREILRDFLTDLLADLFTDFRGFLADLCVFPDLRLGILL